MRTIMKKIMRERTGLALTAVLLLSSLPVFAEKAVYPLATTTIDLTVTGSAGNQLANKIALDLQNEAKKLPRGDMGELAADLKKDKLPEIVMGQFKKTEQDIFYAGTDNKAQRLDIVYPFAGEPPYKVIVNFHGGGWEAGDKRSANSAAVQLAAYQGYAVVNAGYRLSGEAKWPAQIHDAKAAIRFIRGNAGKYQLDVEKIVVWGNSAGGHLAEMLGATNGSKDMEDLSMGNSKASSSVQGVVAWYGAADMASLGKMGAPLGDKLMGYAIKNNPKKASAASPIEYVTRDFPPILLVHGTNDQVVPFVQSIEMAKKVNAATGRTQAKVKLFINGSHGDEAIKSVENVADSLDFVDGILFTKEKNKHRSNRYETIKVTD